jgi:hypothetical protein
MILKLGTHFENWVAVSYAGHGRRIINHFNCIRAPEFQELRQLPDNYLQCYYSSKNLQTNF